MVIQVWFCFKSYDLTASSANTSLKKQKQIFNNGNNLINNEIIYD